MKLLHAHETNLSGMKFIKPAFLIIVMWAFLSSCGPVNKVNGTIILGSWKFDKVKLFTPSSTEAASGLNAMGDASKSSSSKEGSEAAQIKRMAKESVANNDIAPILEKFPDLYTVVEFRQDKTATLTTKNKTANGTWKINRAGTKVTFRETATKQTVPLVLNSVDFTFLEITNPVPEGSFNIQYKNVKK
jgi:hypothetical protein